MPASPAARHTAIFQAVAFQAEPKEPRCRQPGGDQGNRAQGLPAEADRPKGDGHRSGGEPGRPTWEQAPRDESCKEDDQKAKERAGDAHRGQGAAQEAKSQRHRVGIEWLVPIPQGKVDRAFARQDLFGLGAKRSLVVRHAGGDGVQPDQAQKKGRGQEGHQHPGLCPTTRPPGFVFQRHPQP
jgi:hypothetical protein